MILDLYNGIAKESCIPEDWKSRVLLPIYKGKDDPMESESYRGVKLFEHAMVESMIEYRFRQQIDADDMQFDFMKGKGPLMTFLLGHLLRDDLINRVKISVRG